MERNTQSITHPLPKLLCNELEENLHSDSHDEDSAARQLPCIISLMMLIYQFKETVGQCKGAEVEPSFQLILISVDYWGQKSVSKTRDHKSAGQMKSSGGSKVVSNIFDSETDFPGAKTRILETPDPRIVLLFCSFLKC